MAQLIFETSGHERTHETDHNININFSIMSSSFFTQLRARVDAIDSLLCVGLDPHVSELPEPTAAAAQQFCLRLIEQTHAVAAAYKPNSAFFEAFGAEGVTALHAVIKAVPAGIPVLLDAKRGDISTTAAAYAVSAFDQLEAHAITLAPYMGVDSIDPFIRGRPERGCFVLCKTSNPSASDLQTLRVSSGSSSSRLLFEEVALKCHEWNAEDNVGLVVGATDVDALRRVRAVTPNLWILAPGIGAQGGNLEEAVFAGLSADGYGMLVPVSRGISKAANPKEAAESLRDAINAVRKTKVAAATGAVAIGARESEFIKFALSFGVLKFGDFTLKSGRQSPYFFNAGLFRTGRALGQLGKFYAQAIRASGIEFDVLFGPAYKGITLSAAVAIAYAELYDIDLPFAYNRKEAKDHGEGGVLVGADMTGKRCVQLMCLMSLYDGSVVSNAVCLYMQCADHRRRDYGRHGDHGGHGHPQAHERDRLGCVHLARPPGEGVGLGHALGHRPREGGLRHPGDQHRQPRQPRGVPRGRAGLGPERGVPPGHQGLPLGVRCLAHRQVG